MPDDPDRLSAYPQDGGADHSQRVEPTRQARADIAARFGKPVSITGKFVNKGGHGDDERRWPKLLDCIKRDANLRRLEAFVRADEDLIADLGLEI